MARIQNIEQLKTAMKLVGYDNFKLKTQKKLIVNLPKGADRVAFLKKIADTYKKEYKAKYNDLLTSDASIGVTEFEGGYYVIAKSAGGGSGAGADVTKFTESMQCYYCSYIFNQAKKEQKQISQASLYSAEKYVDASVSLKDCIEKGPEDWTDTYIKTANLLFKKYGSKMRSPVYFHRGSSFMNNLYKAKANVHKIDLASPNPQAPGSFSNDKWNPGDIWASTLGKTSTPLSKCEYSWGELNRCVLDSANNGELLGISLKKVPTNRAAIFEEYNKSDKQKSKYKYEGFSFGKTGDFFSSQDIYMTISGKQVQFRTFNGVTSWQGEVKGDAAAGGKIGGGNVNFFCRNILKRGDIYGGKGSEQALLLHIKNKNFDLNKTMYDLYVKHNDSSKGSKPLLSRVEFDTKMNDSTQNFKVSKLICMYFIDLFLSGSNSQRDEIVTQMFLYASSNLSQSSYFVKIS